MTKEELKQEAEIYSYKLYHSKAWNPGEDMLVKAYLAGAEPRERLIVELKGLVNQYKASKCSGISLVNRNMIMSDQLTKAKELLKQWLQTSKASGCDNINIITDTEQFISEVEK